jgi:protein SCO1/2
MTPKLRAFGYLAAAATTGALGLATWLAWRPPTPIAPEIGGYVLFEPRPLPTVLLIDEQGMPFPVEDFAGSWSFVYFGYTFCPDVCPLTLLELASVKRALAAESPAERVRFYLISVDPQRDTPERLREYVSYFDPEFRGLTGTPSDLAELAEATSSLFFVPEGQGTDNYLVDHSSNVVLLNPAGELQAILTPPHTPEQLAADFATIRAHTSSRN